MTRLGCDLGNMTALEDEATLDAIRQARLARYERPLIDRHLGMWLGPTSGRPTTSPLPPGEGQGEGGTDAEAPTANDSPNPLGNREATAQPGAG